MIWIVEYIVLILLFQEFSHGAEIAADRSVRESDRAAILKRNAGSERDEAGPIISDECKRIGICDDVPNYPEELVAKLIDEMARSNEPKFNKDELGDPQIAERFGPNDEYIDLCSSVQKLFAPRAAQDMNNDWHVIVNDKQKPQQTFRVELCQNTNSTCSSPATFPIGYESKCIQKFILRKMVALNEKNEIVERAFQVPSCCSCVARHASKVN